MANKSLTIPEKSTLLVLALMGTEVSNAQIDDSYGFKIDRSVRDTLSRRGLIDARKETRPRVHYLHALTDAGWLHARRELAEPLPKGANKQFRILHGVLRALDTHLTSTDQDLKAFLHPHEDGDRFAGDVSEWIESAYESLVGRPGGWVSLTRLRSALARVPRAEMDDALRQLSRRPEVYLIPEANQKILTAEDRAAAVDLGGEAKHLLSIDRS